MNRVQKSYEPINEWIKLHYSRVIYLYVFAGYDGLENADYVDDVNTYIRDDLQVHIRQSRPSEKLRYSNILLCLHTLFGINCKVVDTLFCMPRANGLETCEFLRDLLQEPWTLVNKRVLRTLIYSPPCDQPYYTITITLYINQL